MRTVFFRHSFRRLQVEHARAMTGWAALLRLHRLSCASPMAWRCWPRDVLRGAVSRISLVISGVLVTHPGPDKARLDLDARATATMFGRGLSAPKKMATASAGQAFETR